MGSGGGAAFDYVAIAPDGRTLRGRVEADDRGGAVRWLQEAGSFPVEVRPAGTSEAPAAGATGDQAARLRPRELARVTRGLALLLGAGLQVDLALDALAAAEGSGARRGMLRGMRDAVRAGAPLSTATGARPGAFPAWYTAALATAEGTGRLPAVLDRLAAEVLRMERVAERVRAGLTYPALVLALAVAAVGVLITVVLPALAPLFASAGNRLPPTARFVLDTSAALQQWGGPALAVLLAAALLARRALAAPRARRWRDERLLRLPLVGPLAWRAATARFARLLAVLLGAGVPLASALRHAGAAAGNAVVAAGIERAGTRLSAGSPFAAALAAEATLPSLAVTLIGIGEEGGRLREMLEEVATVHEEEAERMTERLLALLVPGVTLVLGGVVAGIVLVTLNAILAANSAALGGP